jgi:hypothetical protein
VTRHFLDRAQVSQLLALQAAVSAPEEEESLLHGTWYSTEEMAALLKVDPSTLRRWRTARPPQGPPFVQLAARHYTYSAADVEAWLTTRRVDPQAAAA